MDIEKKLYTITEVAELCGVTTMTVHRWINKGTIEPVDIHRGHRKIPEIEVKKLLGLE
jgi:excisionase family DNA binding protein